MEISDSLLDREGMLLLGKNEGKSNGIFQID